MKRGLGFTLVEVLVVVAIVGILTAIAVPQYSQYVMRGKVTEATGMGKFACGLCVQVACHTDSLSGWSETNSQQPRAFSGLGV